MAMSKNITDREYNKFVEDSEGNTSVRMLAGIRDSDGETLEINKLGAANTYNARLEALVHMMLAELQKINKHLVTITDLEELNGD